MIRRRAALGFLALAGVCAVFIGGFLGEGRLRSGAVVESAARPSPDTATGGRGQSDFLADAAGPEVHRRAVVEVPSGHASSELSPTVWDAFEILDQAIGSTPPGGPPSLDFESKYAGATDAQIFIAHAAAKSKLERERTRISQELIDQGRYAESIVQDGDPSPFPQATRERPVVSFGFEIESGAGFQKIRLAEIDSMEYPEFHAIESEYFWLGNKVAKLKKDH